MIPHKLCREEPGSFPLDHPGLVWSRLAPPLQLPEGTSPQDKRTMQESRDALLDALAGRGSPPSYPNDAERLRRATLSVQPFRKVLFLLTEGRVSPGLGEPSPAEVGLSFHHTYGVPYLPGSSLKGLARAWCRSTRTGNWADGGADFATLFGAGGDEGEGGAVDFLDALPEPGFQLCVEVSTPHHGKYYQGQEAPKGWDGPIPVKYLAASGTFRVVLEGPEGWLDAAETLLREALEGWGVGAKTRAGFGRMRVVGEPAAEKTAREAWKRARMGPADLFLDLVTGHANPQALEDRLLKWILGEDAQGWDPFSDIRPKDPTLQDGELRRAIRDWLDSRNCVKRWRKDDKPRSKQLLAVVESWSPPKVAEPVPPPEPSTRFGPNHLDRASYPKKLDLNSFSKKIADGRFDEETVREAVRYLQAAGAKPGHLKNIWRAYHLPDGWPDSAS